MLRLLLQAELGATIIVVGALITLASGTLVGHRAHRWLYYFAPAFGRTLPADTGAWLGLAMAGLFLAA